MALDEQTLGNSGKEKQDKTSQAEPGCERASDWLRPPVVIRKSAGLRHFPFTF